MMNKGIDFTGISVVYFCHDGKGNFLMHRRGKGARDENGTWDIGAGGLELHDGVEDTLRKEIKEEYSTNVLEFEFLGFRDLHRLHMGRPTHWITLDFKVMVDASLAKNGEPHKFDEVKWVKFPNLPSPRHSQVDIFLEKYKNRL